MGWSDGRVPVEKVEVKVDNMFLPLVSKRSGYWKVPDEALTTGVPPTSMQLSLVSVLGDRLDDNIVSLEWQESDGQLMALRNLQWPVSSRYASMVDREPSCSNDGLVWFPIPAEKDEDKEEEISTPAATTLSPTPSPTTAPKTQTPSPTADIPGPQPTTPAPPNDFDFSSELIPNFFRPAEVPKFPWEALSGFSLPVETTVPTAAPQTPPPTEAPMPIGDLCALCQVTFKPVCDKNRTLYINPCFALCKGLKESEVSQRQCTGGARSGDLSFDIASCVPCEKRGYSEVCNEAQGRFVNQCFAVECLNQDPDSVSAELCGAST